MPLRFGENGPRKTVIRWLHRLSFGRGRIEAGPADPGRTPNGHARIGGRLGVWARRYLPLEVVATIAALAGGLLAAAITSHALIIAYGAAWAENIGFYSVAFVREMRAVETDSASAEIAGPDAGSSGSPAAGAAPWSWARCEASLRRLAWEFGVAELVDSFVARPFCMLAATALLGGLEVGIIVGKLVADALFYGIAIVFHEIGLARDKGR